jgi:hypothetical protein
MQLHCFGFTDLLVSVINNIPERKTHKTGICLTGLLALQNRKGQKEQ